MQGFDTTTKTPEAHASDFLYTLLENNDNIFIDTCSWMEASITSFVDHLIAALQRVNAAHAPTIKKVCLILSVRNELEKFSQGEPDTPRYQAAVRAAREINRLYALGLIKFIGNPGDTFPDNILVSQFNMLRLTQNLALITQDKCLAKEIYSLNASQVSKGKRVVVHRINQHGYLSPFSDLLPSKPTSVPSSPATYTLASRITTLPDRQLQVSHIPGQGDSVQIGGRTYPLTEQIGGGTEGAIFTTPGLPDKVIKIYNAAHLNTHRQEKLRKMVSRPISHAHICWPEQLVQNQQGEFVGYLMKKAQGRTPNRSLFIRPLFEKYFPGWTRTDLVELCITFLCMVAYLHERNIIIGDINPENLLIVSPNEVYFVDCDSYQIEDLPCPVGTFLFTPPELQGKVYGTFLRSFGNEYFSVATMLFMLMMPGKPPYSHQGGGDPVENIRSMNFSYPLGENSNQKQPEGPWRYMWSQMVYKIKEMFYQTFRKGEPHSTEDTRFTAQQWLEPFRTYHSLLESGKLSENDEQATWLYPTRFKSYPVNCKTCQKKVRSSETVYGNCPACDARLHSTCLGCRKSFYTTQLKHGYCKDCNSQVVQQQLCRNCGKAFPITRFISLDMKAKGKNLPQSCPDCHEKWRNGTLTTQKTTYTPSKTTRPPVRITSTPVRSTSTPVRSTSTPVRSTSTPVRSTSTTRSTPARPTPPPKKKKNMCFITTAVCAYLGKPDDCWELTLLRHFRDHYMKSTVTGTALVAQYYEIAPSIVSALDASDQKDLLYSMLWQLYIKPCLRLIVDEKPAECQQLYQDMVEMLKEHIRLAPPASDEDSLRQPVDDQEELPSPTPSDSESAYFDRFPWKSQHAAFPEGSNPWGIADLTLTKEDLDALSYPEDEDDSCPEEDEYDASLAEDDDDDSCPEEDEYDASLAEDEDDDSCPEEDEYDASLAEDEDDDDSLEEDEELSPHYLPVVFCLDVSKTMDSEAMEELNEGVRVSVRALTEVLRRTSYYLEACIVAFDSEAMLVRDFTRVDQLEVPPLRSRGRSMHIAKGINLSLDLIQRRKKQYLEAGYLEDSFTPCLVLMTAGHLLGEALYDVEVAMERIREYLHRDELALIPVCLGPQANSALFADLKEAGDPLSGKELLGGGFWDDLLSELGDEPLSDAAD